MEEQARIEKLLEENDMKKKVTECSIKNPLSVSSSESLVDQFAVFGIVLNTGEINVSTISQPANIKPILHINNLKKETNSVNVINSTPFADTCCIDGIFDCIFNTMC